MTAAFLLWNLSQNAYSHLFHYSGHVVCTLVQCSHLNSVNPAILVQNICHAKDCRQKCICKKFLTWIVPCQRRIHRKTETLWSTGSRLRLHKEYENINVVSEQKLSISSKATKNLCTC